MKERIELERTPQIFIERQHGFWAVQELDTAPTTRRFSSKTEAEAEGAREARRLAAELVVLDVDGRIERWESFGGHRPCGQDWIGADGLTA